MKTKPRTTAKSTMTIEIGREIPENFNKYNNPFRSNDSMSKSELPSSSKLNARSEPAHYYTSPLKEGLMKDESGPTDSTREESFSDDEHDGHDASFSVNHIEPEKTITEHIFSVVCQSAPWVGHAVSKAKSALSDVIQMEACNGSYYYYGCEQPSPYNNTDPQPTSTEEDIKTQFARLLRSKRLNESMTFNRTGVEDTGEGHNQNLWVLTGTCEPMGCVQEPHEFKPAHPRSEVPSSSNVLHGEFLRKVEGVLEFEKAQTGTGSSQNRSSIHGSSHEAKALNNITYDPDDDDDDNDTHALATAEAIADAVRAEQKSMSSSGNKKAADNHRSTSDFWTPNASFLANKISALSSGLVDFGDRDQHIPEIAVEVAEQIPPPIDAIEIAGERTIAFERSVSELTMKSSHAQAISQITHLRRMAYYAVGKHVKNTDLDQRRGGNRRCYFTGKLVVGGKPFYAGKLDQGLKTLVVFCLPAALGLPTLKELKMAGASSATLKHIDSKMSTHRVKNRPSRNLEEDLSDQDSVFEVSTDLLIQALPRPSQKLLGQIERKYPGPYAALPVIVRKPECWGLYTKFCFFSGLPIADGEMYYRVRDEVAHLIPQRAYYGIDEVILSYEVLETANGSQSAEILRLPSSKTFKYLQKHYTQQCSKLTSAVFDRNSWEKIMPEI